MLRRSVVLALLALLTACTPADTETPAEAPAMPTFSSGLQRSVEFYKLEFLPDGFPGKRTADGLEVQPIYGTYVLADYLRQYLASPTPELADALRLVARASVDRMEEHEGALVFWYDPAPKTAARLYERHYSGLTQAYYAARLVAVGQALDDADILHAAERVFASLTIPADKGGVLYPGLLGPSIAEVPQQPNSLILNGWQSALDSVADYADATGSPEAQDLLHRSAAEMARLLPLYDVPSLRNSRYGLSGFQYVRLVLGDGEAAPQTVLSEMGIETPGEGVQDVVVRTGSRWQNQVLPEDVQDDEDIRPKGKTVRLNVVLSRASFPTPNRLRLVADSPSRQKLTVQVLEGQYDPLKAAPVGGGWKTVGERVLEGGRQSLSIPLPWEESEFTAYPTNFAKKIAGEQVNVYHVIHALRLRKLADRTGVAGLRNWADKWDGYVCEWGSLPVYEGLHVSTPPAGSAPVSNVPGCAEGRPTFSRTYDVAPEEDDDE